MLKCLTVKYSLLGGNLSVSAKVVKADLLIQQLHVEEPTDLHMTKRNGDFAAELLERAKARNRHERPSAMIKCIETSDHETSLICLNCD